MYPMLLRNAAEWKESFVRVEGSKAKSLLNLMEALEDQEDVQHAYANFDIADEEFDRQAS